MRLYPLILLACLASAPAQSSLPSRDAAIYDADTRAWWHTTEHLSSDAMEGRDTGSAAYARAAKYVADRFQRAGLEPAGENHTFYQQVPLHEVAVTQEGTSFELIRAGAPVESLEFLQQITVIPTAGLPSKMEAPMAFRGYCSKSEAVDLRGKIAVCFGARRTGLPTPAERARGVRAAGAVGIVNVDDMAFTIEPPRWPDAYARSVKLVEGGTEGKAADGFVTLRLSAAGFPKLLSGTSQSAQQILTAGGASKPLPSFEISARLRLALHTTQRDYSSPNVLGVLPGSDPQLKAEYIVVSAHLDGYGHGTPVRGDAIYNGTLDDAAYVALLIQFADDQKHAGAARLKRSILFCAFTGEEKGLLGATWFTHHPTVPQSSLAADINLDQLRPLFPLNILTALAVDETSLGATARAVATPMHITIRPDREPDRNLLHRADHWPFMQIGVPSIGFIFGYDPGTEAERRYREWYRTEYHRPQDDLSQPMDFEAATKFNTFFYTLTRTLAEASERPAWSAGSPLKPH